MICDAPGVQVDSIAGNTQKLDGGAMFGNAPMAVWRTWCPPDEQNRIGLACRAMLVREDSGRVDDNARANVIFRARLNICRHHASNASVRFEDTRDLRVVERHAAEIPYGLCETDSKAGVIELSVEVLNASAQSILPGGWQRAKCFCA